MKIEYLSSIDSDYKCLEDYIRNGEFGYLADLWHKDAETQNKGIISLFLKNNLFTNLFSENELSSVNKLLETKIKKIILPTKFDIIANYWLVEGLIEKIFKSADALELKKENMPKYASLPTGAVNACAISLPCSKKNFLLFDSQLFTFCNLFAKAFSLSLPIIKNGLLSFDIKSINEHIQKNENGCVDKVYDLLFNYCERGNPSNAIPYLPPKEYLKMNVTIRDAMELMVVGHEYGHFFSGHLANNFKKYAHDCINIEKIKKSHLDEYEADLLGAILTIKTLTDDEIDLTLAYASMELFFNSLLLCEKYKKYSRGVKDEDFFEDDSETHPTFTNRRSFLRKSLMTIPAFSIHANAINSVCSLYDQIINALWNGVMKKMNIKC